MYMELYGLREQPFGVTPNPRFLYFSAMHKMAIASLVNSVCERRGFSALIAKPGMGKTTLIMQLLSLLRDSARTGFLFQTHGNTQEFLSALLHDIDAPPTSMDLADMQRALNAAVLREARANRQMVIVVDEAQNLPDETLESIRLLSNFENTEAKLLHIIFAGQPPLADKLGSPQLSQLRQRLSVVAHLSPFTREQVEEYIDRRLQVAGRTGDSLFTAEALDFIAQASEGIPRNINNLCFHALSLGYASQKPLLDLAIVQQSARALDLKSGPRFQSHRQAPAVSPAVSAAERQSPGVGRAWRLDPLTPTNKPSGRARAKKWTKVKVGTGIFAVAAASIFLFRAGAFPPEILAYFQHQNSATEKTPAVTLKTPEGPVVAPSTPSPSPSENVASASAPTADSRAGLPPKNDERLAPIHSQSLAIENTRVVRTERKEDVEELTRRYFGSQTGEVLPVVLQLNPGIATPPSALPPGTPVMIPAESSNAVAEKPRRTTSERATRAARASAPANKGMQVPVNVRVARTETIFQFAMEHYGKADRATVERIRVANPQIRDIYQTLREGQPIVLPANLEATR